MITPGRAVVMVTVTRRRVRYDDSTDARLS